MHLLLYWQQAIGALLSEVKLEKSEKVELARQQSDGLDAQSPRFKSSARQVEV